MTESQKQLIDRFYTHMKANFDSHVKTQSQLEKI